MYIQNKLDEEPTDDLLLILGSIAQSNFMRELLLYKYQTELTINLEIYSHKLE